MKKQHLLFLLAFALSISCAAQVGISTDGSVPDNSAALDIKSTQKGLLIPRMTETQIFSIVNPATGLIVYNTTTNCVNYFTGLAWMALCGTCVPQPSTADAGPNQAVQGTQTTLSAVAPASGTGSWTVTAGTGGILANPSDPHSLFTGNQPGNYTLTWTVSTNCGSNSDAVTINFINPPPPASAGLTFAPYVDCCLWPNFQIQNVAATGIHYYSCAFIVDNEFTSGANPCWGGIASLGMDYYQAEIASLRSQGGDVIMSFGGASGIELAYAAANEFQARDAYKTVVDAYSLTSIDYDIEGFLVAEPQSVLRRSKAMKLLQTEYPALKISLTLPVMPTGLTADGLNVVQSAINQGVDLFCVNLMAMDYGPSGLDMGAAAISAGEAVFVQLKNLYQNSGLPLSDSLVWRKIGITPMIGYNDTPGEIFYLDDATDLAAWAVQKNINRLAMWSVNRDRQCANSSDPLYSCSHIPQTLYEFSGIFGGVSANP
jgi:chitinase